ncbi:hypothetical protein KFK09_016787 [Dendrobium nobile]|uniref:Uncharacterized protein n=1 Tax=Dendrobium nobile TaxID=94219 RepID=A0A8T3B1L0_DENNO|nr:hypothetical protein KFK09_016787 [Dendrobium nobile]
MTPNTPMMAVLNSDLNRRGFQIFFKYLQNIQNPFQIFHNSTQIPTKILKFQKTSQKSRNPKNPKNI